MSDDRVPCRVCGRCFNPESLTRHERVCSKQTTKKPRKIFDSGRQRAAGSDIPYSKTIKPVALHAGHAAPPQAGRGQIQAPKKSNWRKQHEEFIAAVRAAKAYDRAVKYGGPLPPPAPSSENPDYVQCPTCGRRFNESAASRHISFCSEKSNRVATNKIPNANARMRAEARNYAPPLPGAKPKSTSGGGGRGGMMAGAGDYGYDTYSPASSQASRIPAGAQGSVRRVGGPTGGNGSGGAGGRYATTNRQMLDDNDYDSYAMPAQGPRGSRLGGPPAKASPGAGAGRLAPVGGAGRGGSLGGSSAFGNRGAASGQQAVYLGSNSNGGMHQPRGGAVGGGGRQPHNLNGTYGVDYESMPMGGGSKPVASRGGMSRPVAETGQFCYECGNHYPSRTAKFCVECGVKRM